MGLNKIQIGRGTTLSKKRYKAKQKDHQLYVEKEIKDVHGNILYQCTEAEWRKEASRKWRHLWEEAMKKVSLSVPALKPPAKRSRKSKPLKSRGQHLRSLFARKSL